MPIPTWAWALLGVGGVAVVAGGDPKRASKGPKRLQKMKVFGEAIQKKDAPNGFENTQQVYVKTLGTKMFYVGACMDSWLEDMEKRCQRDTGGNCGAKAIEMIEKLLEWYGMGATEIADWLMERVCIRLRARLKAYEFEGKRYWRVDSLKVGDLDIVMWDGQKGDVMTRIIEEVERANPMTLPKKSGYKRAWLLPYWPAGTRNREAVMLVWPKSEGGPIMQELVPEDELRRMILVLAGSGAFTRHDIERLDRKRSWTLSTLSQVKDEYPGIGDD